MFGARLLRNKKFKKLKLIYLNVKNKNLEKLCECELILTYE